MADDPVHSDAFLQRFLRWADSQPLVRAALLTSTRAVPGGVLDAFSDYDIILVLADVRPFHESRDWLKAFGEVLAMYTDPLEEQDGMLRSGNVIQFEGGLKIDFSLWSPAILEQITAQDALPEEFDAGYLILLDKDHLADGLHPPTYRGYIPKPPSEARFHEVIEWFFVDATYVAKFLWRDDLMAAQHILEAMRQEYLLPLFEWHIELDHGWSVKTGPYGRGLQKRLRPDLWAGLEATYCTADPEAVWDTLFDMIDLMRKTAQEVGARLGFTYPEALEQRVRDHLERVRRLDSGADRFS